MKILAIVSGLDLQNHTRRSTLLAIHKLDPGLEILLFNSVRNYFRPRAKFEEIKTFDYHFWILEKFRFIPFLIRIEYLLKFRFWKSFFSKYDYIFLIDPNQYYLLPYTDRNHKIIYLLRDPTILQNGRNYLYEKKIFDRADLVLPVSKNLKEIYLKKYYSCSSEKVKVWSNSVDLSIWDSNLIQNRKGNDSIKKIGMAGNINRNTDLSLLKAILQERPGYIIEIAGKINLDKESTMKWQLLLQFRNLRYLGFIDFEKLPVTVSDWDVGLIIESRDNEYSVYYNHNKIYQYMALGKPFVSYCHNEDFKKFHNVGFIAQTIDEYIQMVDLAIEKASLPVTISSALKYAEENSAHKKAEEFLFMISQL